MQKNIAGKKVTRTLLLAGLMMSAGAMAASGDPVQGGSGSVTINVPIVMSTCGVSMPTEVNFDPIDFTRISSTVANITIATKTFDIRFTNCKGKAIQMITQSQPDNGATPSEIITGGFDSSDPDDALKYLISMPSGAGLSGGGPNEFFSLRSNQPVTFTPDSDNFIFSPTINIQRTGASINNLGPKVTGGFGYTITYQ
ncbi:type 1 fimbrial protein [Salmonella enterica subsp. houtenae serovar 50:g,z51:-]|nr:type 1 fimbrial protein [Salmonella enterica subsp. houtenae serovar 50:g,z51:-]